MIYQKFFQGFFRQCMHNCWWLHHQKWCFQWHKETWFTHPNLHDIRYVITAIYSLKAKKNGEGSDRIPVRIFIDGINEIMPVLAHLFDLIYKQTCILDQWHISKVLPLFKKVNPNMISNYHPILISNLCSTSKIFEKFICVYLNQLETVSNISLIGKPLIGFKKTKYSNHRFTNSIFICKLIK